MFFLPRHFGFLLFLLPLFLGGCSEKGDAFSSPVPSPSPSPVPSPAPSLPTFTLQGTVTVLPGIVVDSDVNDPNALFRSNNSFATAQVLDNPVTVVGYVNQPGRGAPGRSFASGDVSDFYRISLRAGERIRLNIATLGNDLDLILYDENGQQIARSANTNRSDPTETLTVPRSGTFVVEVRAVGSTVATLYTLNIGGSGTASLGADSLLTHAFVPGEVLLAFDPEKTVDWDTLADFLEVPVRMQSAVLEKERPYRLALALPFLTQETARLTEKTLEFIEEIRKVEGVLHAEPNWIFYPQVTPNDPLYPSQWHYSMLQLPEAWALTTGDRSVTVAVLDTGVLLTHPDLAANLRSDGFDFVRDPSAAGDGDGIDPDPSDPGSSAFGESRFHGTHVAGTIAAVSNNQLGVAGVCWNCQILPVRVLGVEEGTLYDVIQGLRYAAGLSNDSGRAANPPAQIVNLSIGTPARSSLLEEAVNTLVNRGIFVVAAAGNANTAEPLYPAAYPSVISVGAVGSDRQRAPYSNFGPTLDLVAPGGNLGLDLNGDGIRDGVLSTAAQNPQIPNYQAYQGTSMATPHVSGVIALMKALRPSLTPLEFHSLLQSGQITDDLGAPGRDDIFGYGLLNAQKALDALSVVSAPLRLLVEPSVLQFLIGSTSAELQVSVVGSMGVLQQVNVQSAATWFTLTPLNVDARGVGRYQVRVVEGLAPNRYEGQIVVEARILQGNQTVIQRETVEVRYQASNSVSRGGFHYLLLRDADTRQTVRTLSLGELAPSQVFTLRDVPAGRYQLVVGTDLNNDRVICDPGELCGAFPFLDPLRLPVFEVNASRSGLNFSSGLQEFLGTQSLIIQGIIRED